ncbi:DUF4232 domain-containing protein [Embleya sp. NBC_00896]|uniref:DUF4232 domain-containing protein n=1 Tax=Embleya sp. NBC_00896 TaxID=2975961 RepID=UPI002F919ADD|nr:DUF4232 domain-containing protein [Embleya sp. NBC_00896]
MSVRHRRLVPLALLAVSGLLSLTACDSDDGDSDTKAGGGASAASSGAPAPIPVTEAPTGAAAPGKDSGRFPPEPARPSTGKPAADPGTTKRHERDLTDRGGHPTDCATNVLDVSVKYQAATPDTVRLITVTNTGRTDCYIDDLPAVDFDTTPAAVAVGTDGKNAFQKGGTGKGTLVKSRQSVYAAIDLASPGTDSGKATTGTMNVLVDPRATPNAATLGFPVTQRPGGGKARVHNPKVSNYAATADAAAAQLRASDKR